MGFGTILNWRLCVILVSLFGSSFPEDLQVTYLDAFNVTVSNCFIMPESLSWIPCNQFSLPGQYCNKGKELFPDLYVQDLFPGSATDQVLNFTRVTWKTPQDGGVTLLKGFEVSLIGMNNENLGKRCVILDLRNVTDKTLLWDVTFSVEFESGFGEFDAVVKSLPDSSQAKERPGTDIALNIPTGQKGEYKVVFSMNNKEQFQVGDTSPNHTVGALTSKSSYQVSVVKCLVCHPNISISIEFKQLNATHINMTFDPIPSSSEFTVFMVDVLDGEDYSVVSEETLDSAKKSLGKRYRLLENLPLGNYIVIVKPWHEHENDEGRCLCYDALIDGTQRHCNPDCCSYVRNSAKRLSVTPYAWDSPVAESSDVILSHVSEFKVIGIPVLGTMAAVTVLMVIMVLMFRKRIKRLLCRESNQGDEQDSEVSLSYPGLESRPFRPSNKTNHGKPSSEDRTVLVLFTSDNDKHKETVKTLSTFIQAYYNCRVILPPWANTQSNPKGTERIQWVRGAIDTSDVVIIVHSEASFRFLTAWNNGMVYSTPASGIMAEGFSAGVQHIASSGKSNVISVYFQYSHESYVLPMFSSDQLFKLPENLNGFKHRLQQTFGNSQKSRGSTKEIATLKTLKERVEDTVTYQATRPQWFTELYGVSKIAKSEVFKAHSISSGFHDFSLDSANVQRGQSSLTTSSQILEPTGRTKICEHTGNNLDMGVISFIQPDDECQGETTESLLCRTMEDINDRYDFIVTSMKEDDCITVGPVVRA